MPRKHTIDIAKEYVFDAWNAIDHADKMMQGARYRLDQDNVAGTLADLRVALESADDSTHRVRWAIEYLEGVFDEPQAPSRA